MNIPEFAPHCKLVRYSRENTVIELCRTDGRCFAMYPSDSIRKSGWLPWIAAIEMAAWKDRIDHIGMAWEARRDAVKQKNGWADIWRECQKGVENDLL